MSSRSFLLLAGFAFVLAFAACGESSAQEAAEAATQAQQGEQTASGEQEDSAEASGASAEHDTEPDEASESAAQ